MRASAFVLATLLLAPTALGVAGSFAGPGWVALRFDTTGAYDITLAAYSENVRDFHVDGFAKYTAAKEWDGHILTLHNSGVASAIVRANGPVADVRTSRVLQGNDLVTTIETSCASCAPRTFYWVSFQAGELTGWDYVVAATGASVTALQGDEAFGLRTGDFEQGSVASGVALFSPTSIAVDAQHDESAPNTLLAWFLGRAPGMRVQGPGIDDDCPCQFHHVVGPYAAPAGDYSFSLEGLSAPADVVLVGASPQLPP